MTPVTSMPNCHLTMSGYQIACIYSGRPLDATAHHLPACIGASLLNGLELHIATHNSYMGTPGATTIQCLQTCENQKWKVDAIMHKHVVSTLSTPQLPRFVSAAVASEMWRRRYTPRWIHLRLWSSVLANSPKHNQLLQELDDESARDL